MCLELGRTVQCLSYRMERCSFERTQVFSEVPLKEKCTAFKLCEGINNRAA